ncbi:MAG: nuclear transport factor 2 family protein [Anaerolineales bacterium]|nr:nuclear transport factor 2 family protein [Anaerolineales bacterium]
MNELTHEHFTSWMTEYGRASAENDPQASANLFAPDARYYENPFDEPMVGRDAIYAYWNTGAQNLKDKESSFEILAVNGDTGIARWRSLFTVIESGKRLALDCLFVAEFDEEGLCRTFREWWHIREV